MSIKPETPRKGRGAISNREGRFETQHVETVDDGWRHPVHEALPPLPTTVRAEQARSIISRNRSPDIPFELSINPYRGCEHGCVYCYARPSHAYLNLSPGLDFETRLFYKAEAAERLTEELAKPDYVCKPITLGANTDPYQPIEQKLKVTRSLLEVMQKSRQPVSIISKSALIERDLDILAEMARERLATVMMSVTTLDNDIKRSLEPRAAAPQTRLRMIRKLAEAGVPVGVMVAPVIPLVTDQDMERILQSAAAAGARTAGYVFLRLPHAVKDLFREWLDAHMPLKAEHVMSLIRQSRGGRDYDSRFGVRMRGSGEYAKLIGRRFGLACRRFALNRNERAALDCGRFRAPSRSGSQLGLF